MEMTWTPSPRTLFHTYLRDVLTIKPFRDQRPKGSAAKRPLTTSTAREPLKSRPQNRTPVPSGITNSIKKGAAFFVIICGDRFADFLFLKQADGIPVLSAPKPADHASTSGSTTTASTRAGVVGASTKTQPSRHAKSEATACRKSSWRRTPRAQQSAAHPSVCTIVAYMIYHLIEKINPYHLPVSFIFIGLPEHLPPQFSTSGFSYYLQLKLTWFSERYGWITRDHKRLTDVFYQLFFHLALASWMMSGCNHEQFRKAGKVQHLSNTGLAVQNLSDKVRTKKSMYEHYLLDDIIESWCRPCLSDPAPWIEEQVRESIIQGGRGPTRELLQMGRVKHLAYAVDLFLSYCRTYPDGLAQAVNIEEHMDAKTLYQVEDTAENRLELSKMFPVHDKAEQDSNRKRSTTRSAR